MTHWAKRWPETRRRIFMRDNGMCGICGRWIEPGHPWDVDHIVPRKYGGGHEDGNLRLAHHTCNSQRGARAVLPRARLSRWG